MQNPDNFNNHDNIAGHVWSDNKNIEYIMLPLLIIRPCSYYRRTLHGQGWETTSEEHTTHTVRSHL